VGVLYTGFDQFPVAAVASKSMGPSRKTKALPYSVPVRSSPGIGQRGRIGVLWLQGNAIEVESTTSIYSGLLRMSGLVAMQPNLKVPLYIVAPDERRDRVMMEVNRATFSRLLGSPNPTRWRK